MKAALQRLILVAGTIWVGWVGASASDAALAPDQRANLPAPATHAVDFARDIAPILERSCVKCHGKGKANGGFSLETRAAMMRGGDSGASVVPGQSAASYLIELVSGLDPDNVMPQKGSRLTPDQVGLLRAWIDQGLKWDDGIAFTKSPPLNLHPRSPRLPPASTDLAHPVDRLLQSYFLEHGLGAESPVEDRTFARRVYLDVIGLLPSTAEMETFLQDERIDKRDRLVEELLSDQRRYAEHWLSFWNDLLRNDYRGTGYIDGGRKQISAWLYSALATNMNYRDFVAGLINPGPEAEGFVKGIVWRGVVNASQKPEMQAAQNISQVFLGVNLKCASCHDSFINDWALADAYGMASIYADENLEMFRCDKPTGKKVGPKFLYPELGEIPAGAPQNEKRARLAEIMTRPENGRLARTIVNRLWQKFMGRGLVEPVDDMEQKAWHQDLLDWLAEDLAAHDYDLKHTIQVILTSRAYQRPAVNLTERPSADYVFTGPAVRRLSAEQFRDALGQITGVWYDKPAGNFNFGVLPRKEPAETIFPQSAHWIWSEPKAARQALAERVYWRRAFHLDTIPDEATTVITCDNSYTLYVNGTKVISGKDFQNPNFADLRSQLRVGDNLLAVAAVNHTPSNQPPAEDQPPREADANPAGLWIYVRLRQNDQQGDIATDRTWTWSRTKADGWEKPGFDASDWQPAFELGPRGMSPWSLGDKLASTMEVGLMHGEIRSSLVAADPLMTALGRPPREQLLTVRPMTATTLEALEFSNGETLNGILRQGAKNLLSAESSVAGGALVEQVFARALGRPPTRAESQLARGLVGEPAGAEGLEDLLWSVAMLPEFQLIH